MTNERTYRLQSSQMVFAPGVFRWAVEGYRFNSPFKRPKAIDIVTECWGLPRNVAVAVLSGKVAHRVEGEDVVFTVKLNARKAVLAP